MKLNNPEIKTLILHPKRAVFICFAVLILVINFIFHETDYLMAICHCQTSGNVHFIFNKALRVLINDLCMIAIFHFWFFDRSITRLAFYVQLIDTLVLLPVYFLIKLTIEGDSEISSPLFSQMHRLIVNPTLMILLFPAVYFQRISNQR